VRDFLKIYGVVLLFALPCGSIALVGSFDQGLPTVMGMAASQFALTFAALALLGYAVYRHHNR
jgi:hypothetical protein